MSRCFHILKKSRSGGTGTTAPVTPVTTPRRARWSYTVNELLAKARNTEGFTAFPVGYWILGVQSNISSENGLEHDRFYLFQGTFLQNMSKGTTHAKKAELFGFDGDLTTLTIVHPGFWRYNVWQFNKEVITAPCFHGIENPSSSRTPIYKLESIDDNKHSYVSRINQDPNQVFTTYAYLMPYHYVKHKELNLSSNPYGLPYPKGLLHNEDKWMDCCQIITDANMFFNLVRAANTGTAEQKAAFRLSYCLVNEWTP